jgi:hypothetical protein
LSFQRVKLVSSLRLPAFEIRDQTLLLGDRVTNRILFRQWLFSSLFPHYYSPRKGIQALPDLRGNTFCARSVPAGFAAADRRRNAIEARAADGPR